MLPLVDLARYAALEAAIPKLRTYIDNLVASAARHRSFGEPVPATDIAQQAEYRSRLADYTAELAAIAARDTPALPAEPTLGPKPPSGLPILPPLLVATTGDFAAWCEATAGSRGSPGYDTCYRALVTNQAAARTLQATMDGEQARAAQLAALIGSTTGATAQASANDAFGLIGDLAGAIGGSIGTTLTGVVNGLGGILDTIGGSIGTLLGGASGTVGGAVGSVVDSLADLVGGASSTLGGLFGTVSGSLGGLLGDAATTLGLLGNTALDTVASALGGAGDVIGAVGGAAIDAVSGVIGGAGELLGDIVGVVRDRIAAILATLGGAVGVLVEGISGLPAALLGVGGEIVAGVGELTSGAVEALGKLLADPLGGLLGSFFGSEQPEMMDRLDAAIRRMETNPHVPAELKQLSRPGILPLVPIMGLVGAFLLVPLLSSTINTLFQPALTLASQEELKLTRPSLLPLGDQTMAVKRELRDAGWLRENAARLGYKDADIELAEKLTRTLIPPAELFSLAWREIIGPADVSAGLTALGYDPADAALVLAGSEQLPPLADAVRFAVREAFPGQSGYGGARGAGVPAGLAALVKQLGLSEDWARSYWAAHWELPSVSAVFEMFHRGIIDEARLRRLITEADYAPDWHDEIIAVAYSPLTRVDVRRMHATGVLTAAQVEDAYRDLGYSPTDAARLRAFTVKLNADDGGAEAAAERDLTRADVIGAYTDGILGRPALLAALDTLGYDATEAELLADRADFAVARSRRTAVKSGVIAGGVAGTLDAIAMQGQLSAAGFAQGEIDLVLDEVERKRAVKATLPAKADWKAWYGAAIVTADEARAGLSDLGYSEQNVGRYLAGWDAGLADAAEESA